MAPLWKVRQVTIKAMSVCVHTCSDCKTNRVKCSTHRKPLASPTGAVKAQNCAIKSWLKLQPRSYRCFWCWKSHGTPHRKWHLPSKVYQFNQTTSWTGPRHSLLDCTMPVHAPTASPPGSFTLQETWLAILSCLFNSINSSSVVMSCAAPSGSTGAG